jgi:hypothetical protein
MRTIRTRVFAEYLGLLFSVDCSRVTDYHYLLPAMLVILIFLTFLELGCQKDLYSADIVFWSISGIVFKFKYTSSIVT